MRVGGGSGCRTLPGSGVTGTPLSAGGRPFSRSQHREPHPHHHRAPDPAGRRGGEWSRARWVLAAGAPCLVTLAAPCARQSEGLCVPGSVLCHSPVPDNHFSGPLRRCLQDQGVVKLDAGLGLAGWPLSTHCPSRCPSPASVWGTGPDPLELREACMAVLSATRRT